MRGLVALVALVAAACSAPPPVVATPTPTLETGVLTVTALLDLSGPRAAIGTQQRNALQLWMDQARSGVPVKLRTVDLAGSDAKLVIELRRAAVEERAGAVIVGTPVAYDETFARAVDVAALPVLLTLPLPADPVRRAGGPWAFALAPSLPRLAAWEITDATRRGVMVPSLVLTDARDRADPMASAIAAEIDRRRLDPLTRIPLPADGSVPPVVRSALSVLRSVHCTGLASSCAAVAREAQSAGSPTFFYLSYLTTPGELKDDRELAARAVWPGTWTILPSDPPAVTAADQARERFLRTYAERYGPAGAQAATAYDALSLLATAAERGGTDDRAALREALERITMSLIASRYSFALDRHDGFDPDGIVYLRWTGSGVALALAPSLGTGIATPAPSPSVPARAPSPSPTGIP